MKTVSLEHVRNRLLWLWLVWTLALVVIFVIRSTRWMTPEMQLDKLNEMWGWFMPLIAPVTTMIAVITMTAFKAGQGLTVRRTFFILSFALSVVYLAAITLTSVLDVLIAMFHSSAPGQLEVYKVSQLWLGIFESLVIPMISTLFISADKDAGANGPD